MLILKKIAKWALVFIPAIVWIPLALLLSFEGAWLSPVAAKNDHDGFMGYAKEIMSKNLKGSGVLILVEEGKVVDRFYHTAVSDETRTAQAIDGDTLFPAASMSKFVAAIAIHKLVQQQNLDINAPIESYIKDWRLPSSDYDHKQVTIARLLSHTGGLTDGLGFGDYSEHEIVPGLVDSLNNPRSSSGEKRVEVGIQPGSKFLYSGGGYLLLELLIEDVTGESYESWVSHNILQPSGLSRTHFGFIEDIENSTSFYDSQGQQVTSFQYASSAATAMNTSANDLVALLKSIITQPRLVDSLSTPLGSVMESPIWGQGAMLYAPLTDGHFLIGHDGSNDPAINTSIRINPMTGDGYIALISGHETLASEIGFEWVLWQSGKPDFVFIDKAMTSAVVPILVGSLAWIFLVLVFFRYIKRAKS